MSHTKQLDVYPFALSKGRALTFQARFNSREGTFCNAFEGCDLVSDPRDVPNQYLPRLEAILIPS